MTFKLSPHPSDLGRDAGTPELRSDCRLLSNSVVAVEGPVRGILAAMVRLMALHQMLTHLKGPLPWKIPFTPHVDALSTHLNESVGPTAGILAVLAVSFVGRTGAA